jgi:hypothetical protein
MSGKPGISIISHFLVGVAKRPPLAGLSRCNNGMLRAVKVFGCVLILRLVAAANVAAGLAHAQVYPVIAERYAFGADVVAIVPQVCYVERFEVRAERFHNTGGGLTRITSRAFLQNSARKPG